MQKLTDFSVNAIITTTTQKGRDQNDRKNTKIENS